MKQLLKSMSVAACVLALHIPVLAAVFSERASYRSPYIGPET